ncbi:MAG: DUF4288 domain-containing protein [Gemmataceae bacterium]
MTPAKQLCRPSGWKWFSVRSLYRYIALGKPKYTNESYIPDATLVEERVVLIKARNDEEAFRKAKKEGTAYARSIQLTNGYGQRVRVRMLAMMDAYELFDSPGPGAEVFSTTEEIDASVGDEQIRERLIGFGESSDMRNDHWRRFKFIDVKVVRLLSEQLEKAPPSSHSGNEHGR